jgi:hypothetical protein
MAVVNRIFVVLIGLSVPLGPGVAAAQDIQGGVHAFRRI